VRGEKLFFWVIAPEINEGEQTMQNLIVTPRIYVACLAAYNAGHLHGHWIDATQDASAIHAEIAAMLKASPEPGAEEWAVHDYEGFGEIALSEWPDIDRVAALARMIEEHGEEFTIWYEHQDGHHANAGDLEEKFLEQRQGVHDSEAAFADHLLEETGQLSELPSWARNYFDFESYARDLALGGDYTFIRSQGQVYVYSND
jgi:antirestriction protein